MRALNKQAWDNLDPHEQTALSLNFAYDKSTWEAGEIMSRSHYKYLEIKSRAEHFLKLFTEYYKLWNRLIPDEVTGDSIAIEYFRLCLEKRQKPKLAIFNISESRGKTIMKSNLNARIEKQLNEWGKSELIAETQAYHLIKDFDRWNNFRILPKHLQEPSAFKRRLKNVFKKQLKTLRELNEFSLEHLKKLVRATRKADIENCLYLPIIEKDGKPKIYRIKNKPSYLGILDDLSLYYFRTPEQADAYIRLCCSYLFNPERSCQDGLNFWPKFREEIKNAANYDSICNKAPHRKHLEIAFSKIEYI